MPDTKISALTDAASVGSTDELPIVQSSTSKRATVAEVATAIQALTDLDDINDVVITSVADGHVLTWDSGTSRWVNEAPSGGGGSLIVQDENGNVATGVTQIDFQGAGVAATAGTGEVIVTVAGGGGSAELLTAVQHNPASLATTACGTSWGDVDATNLVVSFTFPASGRVLLDMTGFITSNTNIVHWGVRDGTTLVTGSEQRVTNSLTGRFHYSALISGTPGAATTWKFAHWGGASSSHLRGGPSGSGGVGPSVMKVWSA
jgi:hypothetical protein